MPQACEELDQRLRPSDGSLLNLNVGGTAPRLRAVSEAVHNWSGSGSGSSRNGSVVSRVVEEFRAQLATYLSVRAEQVAFLSGTTRAIEVAMLAAAPGAIFVPCFDSQLDLEHASAIARFESLDACFGIELKRIPICGLQKRAVAQTIVATVLHDPAHSKTLFLSHVTASGLVLPVEEVIACWHAAGRPYRLIIDGAHAVGQIPVTCAGAPDAYVFGGHKWLMSPPTLGVLIAGEGMRSENSANNGFSARLRHLVFEGFAFKGDEASAERSSTVGLEPLVGARASLEIVAGVPVHERLKTLGGLFREHCSHSPNIALLDFRELDSAPGMFLIQAARQTLDAYALKQVQDRLMAHFGIAVKIALRPLPGVARAFRICLPFYLTGEEIMQACLKINEALSTHNLAFA